MKIRNLATLIKFQILKTWLKVYVLLVINLKLQNLKIEPHSVLSIPQVSEIIVVDKMLHVKLFSVASPIALPELFRKGSDCCLRKKSMLENFPSCIRNFVEVKKLPDDILSELELIRYKKPVDKPKYSVNMSRYAFLLRYTSVHYKILLQKFPLPSLSLLNKVTEYLLSHFIRTKKNWHWCCFVTWCVLFTKRFTIPRWETCWCWRLRKNAQSCQDIHDKQLKEVSPLYHKSYTWNKNRRKITFRTHW